MAQKIGYKNVHQNLIDKCKRGDQRAQSEIYRLYFKAMFNVSYRILNDSQEAEDAMQESFLKAFGKINLYSGEVSFGAWLKRIVINTSLDLLKKRKVDLLSIEDVHIDVSGNLEEKIDSEIMNHKVEQIKKSIQQLPEGYRLVLSLYLLEGYDHDEIAQILEISGSTSRSQFIRAKKKLLKLLNG